ncbi:MAG: hypothetical protein EOO28_26585 [Comamonadaceae bacterium]|nr:MAG: hypothetical protein EOO28_26585 [Comamonadaceae bacterium]
MCAFKLGLLVIGVGAAGVVLLVLAVSSLASGHGFKALLQVFTGAAMTAVAASFLRLGLRARSAGWLFRLDASGLSHCMLAPIGWPAVYSLDLDEVVVKGQKGWNLRLGLLPGAEDEPGQPAWQRVADLARPRRGAGNGLVIPLAFAALPADIILDTARQLRGSAQPGSENHGPDHADQQAKP